MPCIYIIENKLKKIYTGSSRKDNPLTRVKSHNSGKTKSTKSGKPWKLIYQEYFKNYTEARKREIFLKSGQGRKYIKEKC